ncbi:MAG: PEP-CTERM sorting domain-containing protein [Planctomycetaceae bacterium]
MSLSARAATYQGSLTYTPGYPADSSDGLAVGPSNLQWVNYTVSMSWTVTNEDASYATHPWKYTYTFGHNGTQAAISHLIIEASEGISAANITGLTGATLDSAGMQTVQSGNPDMPEGLVGLKFAPAADAFSMTWTFYSDRAPVWGDFYAKCGGKLGGFNHAYNYNLTGLVESGFLTGDVDPTAAPSNGSVAFHILRPDTVSIPEPATMSVLAAGALAALIRRRRTRA